ncbi:MAG: exodeoxyribonuclease VII large subunit [Verrucomicrobia bacterium]|nr:exodeoxyribonuclease VII large subunit [Verrucomicrobiota bacterium]
MAKPTKSQWDFGELFPAEATRRVLTVSELTGQVKRLLEKQVGQVWVTGEITNFRAQASGHCYFTLKDAGSQLACVLFRGEAAAQREFLRDGAKAVLHGDLTVYEARGQYQLIVRAVELQGVGALQLAFEKLKQKLAAEGLFAPERKRPIPRYPQRIGLVTPPTGAAIRDVLHVIQRRQPGLEIILAPCRVQGDGAANEIVEAIRLLNEFAIRNSQFAIDLILVTRGGGSLEDLWAFNEEVVARAIAASAIPVVSAVGHEIDFTIADFVADLRAATPSAAAELITEGAFASRAFVAESAERLCRLARRKLDSSRNDFEQLEHRLALTHPRRRVEEGLQRLDDLHGALSRVIRFRRQDWQVRWRAARQRLLRLKPSQVIARSGESLRDAKQRLRELMRHQLQAIQSRHTNVSTRLRLLAPNNVLARGYSITTDAATGKVLRDAAEVKAGQRLKTHLKRGEVRSAAE